MPGDASLQFAMPSMAAWISAEASLLTDRSRVMAASDAGADFLVLQSGLARSEITAICEMVPVPVYVPGPAMEEVWEMGASGINEL